jgi:Thioredoxin-like domain
MPLALDILQGASMFAFAKTRTALAAFALMAAAGVSGLAASANAAELIAFVSARCPYCIAWEREVGRVYGKSWEAREAPLRRVDADTDAGSAFLEGLEEVRYTPTFVLIDGDREIGRISGYSGSKSFWPELDRLLATLHEKPTL